MTLYRTRDPSTLLQLLARMRLCGWTDDHPEEHVVSAMDPDRLFPIGLLQVRGDDGRARVEITDRRSDPDTPFVLSLKPMLKIEPVAPGQT